MISKSQKRRQLYLDRWEDVVNCCVKTTVVMHVCTRRPAIIVVELKESWQFDKNYM